MESPSSTIFCLQSSWLFLDLYAFIYILEYILQVPQKKKAFGILTGIAWSL